MKQRNLKYLSALSLAAGSALASHASADVITPSGLHAGDHFYVILVTADPISAVSSDPSVYNTFAQNQAGGMTYDSNTLNWTALGSFDTNPVTSAISLFDPSAPIFLPNGTEVAANGAALWDTNSTSLDSGIDIDSNGNLVSGEDVWTGTFDNGIEAAKAGPAFYFDNGIGNTFNTDPTQNLVEIGSTADTSSHWIESNSISMYDSPGVAAELPIYAVSEELTVPGVVVPLPKSAALGAAALAALAVEEAYRRLKTRTQ